MAFDMETTWDGLPISKEKPGESVPDCVARELREESGLELPFTPTALGDEDWLVCLAEAPYDAIVTLSEEHDRFEWLPARQAAAISLPPLVGEQILGVARLIGDPALGEEQ